MKNVDSNTIDLFDYLNVVQRWQLAVKERDAYKKMLSFYIDGLSDLSDDMETMNIDEIKICIEELSDKSNFEDYVL